jgi:hypothetical protein
MGTWVYLGAWVLAKWGHGYILGTFLGTFVGTSWVHGYILVFVFWVHEYMLGTWVHVEYMGTWVHVGYIFGTCLVYFGYMGT